MPKKDQRDLCLPAQVFFEPRKKFLTFLKSRITTNTPIIEVGAGTGHFSNLIMQLGLPNYIVALDKFPRAETQCFITPGDATTFPYPEKSLVLMARPNPGPWIEETILRACKTGCIFLLIVKPSRLKEDIAPILDKCVEDCLKVERIYDNAGKDREVVYEIWLPRLKGKWTRTPAFFRVTFGHFVDSKRPLSGWLMDGGEYWVNSGGGRCPKKPNDVIHEGPAYVESDEDLDWSQTYLNDPESNSGWLSPSGEWHGCDSQHHDTVARLILRKTVDELEKEGWCRVYGQYSEEYRKKHADPEFLCQRHLTPEQRNWLQLHGYYLEDDD